MRAAPRRPGTRRVGLVALALAASGGLAACGGDSGKPTLTWYINPDAGGQDAVAEACSTDAYTIETQQLPQDAGQQRIQLVRRLEAEDPGIDLMSIDPPYTAEFANADLLAPIDADVQDTLREQSFPGAVDAATWEDEIVVYPFWSNTQVLWYRKSFAEKAGLDLAVDQPVSWEKITAAAVENDGTVAVQANKYEGYAVWINALVAGAGGTIVENTDAGAEADVTIDSDAGLAAAKVISDIAGSSAAPPDLSVSNEGTDAASFGSDTGAFMVNWTFIFHNFDDSDPAVAKDIGYTAYPQTVEGEPSRPPYGGIGIGVSSYSDEIDLSQEAAACIVKPENQGLNADLTGNMPASPAGYEYPALVKSYPADLRQLWQDSLGRAEPRSVSPYWSDISGALQSTWHSPNSVDSETPAESKQFIEEILNGEGLL